MTELPKGWASAPLRDLVEPSSEKVEPAKVSPHVPYLSLEHIEPHTTRILGHGQAREVLSTKSRFHEGDVLYGKLRPYLNKVCIPSFEGVCSTDILVFPQSKAIDNRYLLRFLTQPQVVSFANHRSSGVQLPRVSFHALGEIDVPLPPMAEQRRIVAKIEELLTQANSARAHLSKVPAILKCFRQSVLDAACSGRLTEGWREAHSSIEPATALLERIRASRTSQAGKRPGSRSGPGGKEDEGDSMAELPATWVSCRVADVASVALGGTPSRKTPRFWGGPIAWVSSGEVANCRITETREKITAAGLENSNAKIYPPGTVLIAMIGEGKTRGQSAILDIAACTNQNVAGLVFEDGNVDPEYMWRWALSQYERTRGVGRGGNQPALNGQKVRELRLALPPLGEQREIARRVEALFTLADAIQQRVDRSRRSAEALAQSILAKAFRGELVPTEAELAAKEGREYEPASKLLERIHAARADNGKPTRRRRSRASAV